MSGTGGAVGSKSGTIVVLNGVPRSGKSSIVRALQRSAIGGPWLNLGVDTLADAIPADVWPGIGLRPGGERPDLEGIRRHLVPRLYATVAAWSRAGLNVVVDAGHHDDYSRPLGILGRVAVDLAGLPAYFVGVRCPVDVIMARRDAGSGGRGGAPGGPYVTSEPDGSVPDIVVRWEQAVHEPGIYDLEVDTSTTSPDACAAAVMARVEAGQPVAFAYLARART